MRIGKMLGLYCAAMSIQQKDLAKQLDISESSLTRLIRGDAAVNALSYAKIVLWLSEEV